MGVVWVAPRYYRLLMLFHEVVVCYISLPHSSLHFLNVALCSTTLHLHLHFHLDLNPLHTFLQQSTCCAGVLTLRFGVRLSNFETSIIRLVNWKSEPFLI